MEIFCHRFKIKLRLPSPIELSYDLWQKGDPGHQFSQWNSDTVNTEVEKENKVFEQSLNSSKDQERLRKFILRKFLKKWREKTVGKIESQQRESCPEAYWLPKLLFCKWSQEWLKNTETEFKFT